MDIKLLQALLKILGNVTLSEAVKWVEVEENARRLREEGHLIVLPEPDPEN